MTDLELLGELRSRLDVLKTEISALKVGGDQQVSLPGQYVGKPIPSRIGAEIDFDGTMRKHQADISVEADGPFHATSIHFAFRFTSGIYSSSWSRISSIEDLQLNFYWLDFYWEYRVSGSGRDRQNIPVPSAMVYRSENGNGWFPLIPNDVFDPVSKITVVITPTISLAEFYPSAHVGKLWVGFNGFYVLDKGERV